MLRFECTDDLALVRQIITHPRIWPHITDDGCGKPEDFTPQVHDSIKYVIVENGTLQGMFMFAKQNSATWEVHTCMLPGSWGETAKQAAAGVREWIWQNTDCQRIVTTIPVYNRLAVKFAKQSGMSEYGRNPKSFLKDGVLHDQILMGVSRCRLP